MKRGDAPCLLDANVLIAMADEAHDHHAVVAEWVSAGHPWALCPITEGAVVRYLIRRGVSAAECQQALTDWKARDNVQFWADSLGYDVVDLRQTMGHRQITDAYLLALAVEHRTVLVTLDAGILARSRALGQERNVHLLGVPGRVGSDGA